MSALKRVAVRLPLPLGLDMQAQRVAREELKRALVGREVRPGMVPFLASLPLKAEVTTGEAGTVTPETAVEVTTTTTSAKPEEERSSFFATQVAPDDKLKKMWDSVVGQERLKSQHLDTLLKLARYKEAFGRISHVVNARASYLLDGPPGTGKTTFATGVAHAFAWRMGCRVAVHKINSATLLDKYVGQSARNIAEVFEEIREKSEDYPFSFLIVDEYDAIAGDRLNAQEHPDAKRAVNSLLTELDRFEFPIHRTFVYGISNIAGQTDRAILRRFDEVFRFELPDPAARRAILESKLRELTTIQSLLPLRLALHPSEVAAVAQATRGYSGSDLARLVSKALLLAMDRRQPDGKLLLDRWCVNRALQETKPAHEMLRRGQG